MTLVLDSGAVSHLAVRDRTTAALLLALRRQGLWPPVVPSVVLVECLTGSTARDVGTHRLLATCDIRSEVSEGLARRAASLHTRARRGSAVDALVVATAQPGDTDLTGDRADLRALADEADDVVVEVL